MRAGSRDSVTCSPARWTRGVGRDAWARGCAARGSGARGGWVPTPSPEFRGGDIASCGTAAAAGRVGAGCVSPKRQRTRHPEPQGLGCSESTFGVGGGRARVAASRVAYWPPRAPPRAPHPGAWGAADPRRECRARPGHHLGRNWFRAGMGAEPAPWTPGERVAQPLAPPCHPELLRLDARVLFCWEVCPLPEARREAYL